MWFKGTTISVIAIVKHIRIANAMEIPKHPIITVMTRWGIESYIRKMKLFNIQVFFSDYIAFQTLEICHF